MTDKGEQVMRYDPEDKQYYFSTEMIQSKEGSEACYEHFKAYQKDMLDNPRKVFGKMTRTADGEPQNPIPGIIMGVALFGGILGTIFSLCLQKFEYIPWILGAAMLLLGVPSFFTADVSATKVQGFTESTLCLRIEAVIGILGGTGLMMLGFLYPKDVPVVYALAVFCGVSLVVFLVMLVKTIDYATVAKSVYKEEIQADCIGYVRTYEVQNSGPESNMPDYIPMSSPVFEYYYGGSKYQSCYDNFDVSENGKIEVGSKTAIRINPEAPEHVLGSNKKYYHTPMVLAVVSLAAFIVLLVLILR